jgi:CubicO group peptidase (beta-lactamase class C family)
MKRLYSCNIVAAFATAFVLASCAGAEPTAGNVSQPVAQPTPTPTPTPAIAWTATGTLAKEYTTQKKVPGIVLAVSAEGQPTRFLSEGRIAIDANAAATGPDTLWRVYSMTKPITGMAAMILVEEGKLKLDQPISDFFPGYKTMTVAVDPSKDLTARPAAREITVRHLLTHTAGMGYSISLTGPLLAEYERLGLLPGAVNRQIEAGAATVRPKTLREFAERAATVPLIADPGTRWSYSMSIDVLAAVVEAAAGVGFEQFVSTRIFQPLGMTSSYWRVPASEVGRFVDNYMWAGDNLAPLDPAAQSVYLDAPSFPYGGAGLVMSARDYDRFLAMLQNYGELDGRRILRRETAELAMSNLLPAGVTYGGVAGGTGGQALPQSGYGAAGSVTLADIPGGPGAGTYGWGGAAGTIAWVDPKNRVRATGMVNYFPAEKYPLREDMIKAIYSDRATR